MIVCPKHREFKAHRWLGSTLDKYLICNEEPLLCTIYVYQDTAHVNTWIIDTIYGAKTVEIGDVILRIEEGKYQVLNYDMFKELFYVKET